MATTSSPARSTFLATRTELRRAGLDEPPGHSIQRPRQPDGPRNRFGGAALVVTARDPVQHALQQSTVPLTARSPCNASCRPTQRCSSAPRSTWRIRGTTNRHALAVKPAPTVNRGVHCHDRRYPAGTDTILAGVEVRPPAPSPQTVEQLLHVHQAFQRQTKESGMSVFKLLDGSDFLRSDGSPRGG